MNNATIQQYDNAALNNTTIQQYNNVTITLTMTCDNKHKAHSDYTMEERQGTKLEELQQIGHTDAHRRKSYKTTAL